MQNSMESQKPRWYDKKGTVILFLIIFSPLGFYGMWKNKQFSTKTKLIILGLFTLVILISILSEQKTTPTSKKSILNSVAHTEPEIINKENIAFKQEMESKLEGKDRRDKVMELQTWLYACIATMKKLNDEAEMASRRGDTTKAISLMEASIPAVERKDIILKVAKKHGISENELLEIFNK